MSYFLLTKYALPYLKESKGNILNVGSKVALTGQGGTSGYAAAKGGVLGLTREWAVDLIKFGIRSNALIIAESYTPAYEDWIKTLEDGEATLAKINKSIPFESRMTKNRGTGRHGTFHHFRSFFAHHGTICFCGWRLRSFGSFINQ